MRVDIEVLSTLRACIQQTAKQLDVQGVEWKFSEELLNEIEAVDSEMHHLLVTFVDAYLDWYRVAKKLEELQRVPDAQESAHHARVVGLRNQTRSAILKRLETIAGA